MNKVFRFSVSWLSYSIFFSIITFFWLFDSKLAIFGTNDDELMSSILNGAFGENFRSNLIFIQPILTYPLSYLQSLITSFNLYSIFLVEVVIFSYSAILASFYIFKNKLVRTIITILFTLYGITFISWFSINPTYTGASLYSIGTAAYFLFLMSVDKKVNTKLNLFLISLFLLLGFFIRKESLFIFFLISIPITSLYLYKNKGKNINIKAVLITIFSISLLITFNSVIFKNSYQGIEWQNYNQMNNLRHKIQLRAPERSLYLHLSEVDWDNETYQMFQRFALLDKSEMNSLSMEKILTVTKEYVGFRSVLNSPFISTIKSLIVAFQPWTWILKLILLNLAIFFIILIFTKSKISLFLRDLIIYFVPIISGIVVISSGYQLPERITLNLLASSIPLIFLIFYSNFKSKDLNKLNSSVIFAIIALSSILYLNRFSVELNARQDFYKSRISYSTQQQEFLSKLNSESVLLGSASVFRSDWRFPFTKYDEFDFKSRIITLGWHNLSPLWMQKTHSIGVEGSNFPNEYFNPKLIYVENPENILVIQKYLKAKNFKFTLNEISEFGPSDFKMYKFTLD